MQMTKVLAVFAILFFSFSPLSAFAYLLQQNVETESSYYVGSVGSAQVQYLGTGLSGVVTSIEVSVTAGNDSGGNGADHAIRVYQASSELASLSALSTIVVSTTSDPVRYENVTQEKVLFNVADFSLDATKHYYLYFYCNNNCDNNGLGSNAEYVLNGSPSNLYSNGYATSTITSVPDPLSGVSDFYFTINGYTSLSSTATRILSLNSPANGSVTSTTTVEFDFDYYFNSATDFGKYDEVGFDLVDLTEYGLIFTDTQPIIASGGGSYNASYELEAGHTYQWSAFIQGTSGNAWIRSDKRTFSVITAGNGQSLLSTTTSDVSGNASSTDLFSNLPAFFVQYPPFSYINNFAQWIGGFATSSEQDQGNTLDLPFGGGSGVATTVSVDLDFVSTLYPVQVVNDLVIKFMWALAGIAIISIIRTLV